MPKWDFFNEGISSSDATIHLALTISLPAERAFFLFSPSVLAIHSDSFIRQSLPLEPLFHTQALDDLLRGVAIETSELFRQFYNGLAKILSIAQEPQLRDVSCEP